MVFTVTYTDGSISQFTQNMSSWTAPENHSGESIAYSGTYCDTNTGGFNEQKVDLYRYSFPLNTTKTVQSLTLPSNPNIAIAAITLLGK